MTKYGRPAVGGPGVEDLGDVRVVHQGQGLPLGLEPGDHLPRVHPRLDHLQGDPPADRLGLLGHEHHAHPALADLLQQLVRADRPRPPGLGRPGSSGGRVRSARGRRAVEEAAGAGVGGEQASTPPQGRVAGAGPVQERRPVGRVGDVQGVGEDGGLRSTAGPPGRSAAGLGKQCVSRGRTSPIIFSIYPAGAVTRQMLSLTGSFGWNVSSGELFWSEETYRIVGLDPISKPTVGQLLKRVHPEDVVIVKQSFDCARLQNTDLDFEHRFLMPDGKIKHVHVVAHAVKDEMESLKYVGAVTDVTETKLAEEKIRQDERELRQIVEAIHQLIIVLAPDGRFLYANEAVLEYTGFAQEDVVAENFRERVIHPEDLESLSENRKQAISNGVPFEAEYRVLRKDGQYRWFLTRLNPLRDERGEIIRWYATAIDIHDRKEAEEKIRKENIALREEIDKTSMFEEIVGTSKALQTVLSRVSRVAPTDSTVLIHGETGTGKELIARAIHKRSERSSRAFISVNCSAIPSSLIASELFGHEKGAFTGALQRRLGRFELADGGTIFLDEIGELPSETQIALLRVLQEREFERVGGNQTIRADVRVITATNRDLQAAIVAGTFRSDLFYRLNVVPIEMPPLHERKRRHPTANGVLHRSLCE